MKRTQLKIGDVSRVTHVPIPTLCRWLDRRTMVLSRDDKPSNGTGDHRMFSRSAVNKIAIARKLIEFEIAAGPANTAAEQFTDKSQPGRAANECFAHNRTMLCLRPSGPVVINAPFYADFEFLSDHGAGLVSIDCGKVCSEVDIALSHYEQEII